MPCLSPNSVVYFFISKYLIFKSIILFFFLLFPLLLCFHQHILYPRALGFLELPHVFSLSLQLFLFFQFSSKNSILSLSLSLWFKILKMSIYFIVVNHCCFFDNLETSLLNICSNIMLNMLKYMCKWKHKIDNTRTRGLHNSI